MDLFFFQSCVMVRIMFFVWLLITKTSNMLFVLMKVDDVWQMTTAIAIEDVRREVKILRALTGHRNLVQFYEAYEDNDNVYIVME